MIYPAFLKVNDTIGVSSPSDGMSEAIDSKRVDLAKNNFENLGYKIIETEHVRTSNKARSCSAKKRCDELLSLYLNKDVKAIICACGGEFLVEMLSYLDLNIIKDNPKWIQGYSDPTGLLFTITTNLDIATIYGPNFGAYAMKPWHESLTNSLKLLEGYNIEQKSFSKYASSYTERIIGDEPYNLDKNVKWENLNNEDKIKMSGRLIGGCIDILEVLFGTRFDKTLEFIERYKSDGIIWYFDNCELSCEDLIRTLWKFKDKGWFKYTNGIIFGRSATEVSNIGNNFKDSIKDALNDLNIPIIINADLGHVAPSIPVVNGAIAKIVCENSKGTISFIYN